MKKIILGIDGMTCSACSNGLEKYLNKQNGIINASVNLVMSNASIDYDETILNQEKLEKYIQNNYSAEPDYPWVKYPDYEVFRHTSNKKWFALIMEIPKDKLGLQTKDIL